MSTGLFRVIAIIGQKGGTGKTTTTVELAVTAANAGETVAVIDLDPQANAANWKDRREADNPYVVATPPGRLKHTIDAARTAEADLAIIDRAELKVESENQTPSIAQLDRYSERVEVAVGRPRGTIMVI